MEHIKLVLKGWLKSILKPIVLKEILDDITKLFIKIWIQRFSILLLILSCMVINLQIAVWTIRTKMDENIDFVHKQVIQ